MQKENKPNNYIDEDTIDLKELLAVLVKRKTLIISITIAITLISVIYAFMKTPMYEAKATVEIGDYKLLNNNNNNNNNNKVTLDNASQLSKKLHILFMDMNKNKKAKITSISVPRKQNTFITIKSLATNNKLARDAINNIVVYIQKKHQMILDDVKHRRELEIKNINARIKDIKTKELTSLEKKISIIANELKNSKYELKKLKDNINKIDKNDSSWIALNLMQMGNLEQHISGLEIKLIDLESTKNNLITAKINQLVEKKTLIASMLLPYNYKNSQVVGKIITNKYPIKPKKKLIVIISFVIGLFLSIFFAFFLEFIQKSDDK